MSAIDRARRLLFVTTGNNYSVPAGVAACVNAAATDAAKQAATRSSASRISMVAASCTPSDCRKHETHQGPRQTDQLRRQR
jgi:hypothetical protein